MHELVGFYSRVFPGVCKGDVCARCTASLGPVNLSEYNKRKPFSLNYITFPDPSSDPNRRSAAAALVLLPFLYFSPSNSFFFPSHIFHPPEPKSKASKLREE